MDESNNTPSVISPNEAYSILSNFITHSEDTRWGRLNTLLVVNSVLIVAWAAIFSGLETAPSNSDSLLLTVICIPGILLGIIWSFLGRRTSDYLDAFHDQALLLEIHFEAGVPKPLTDVSEKLRDTVRRGPKRLTSSKWIVTWIPVQFSLFFFILLIFSWVQN